MLALTPAELGLCVRSVTRHRSELLRALFGDGDGPSAKPPPRTPEERGAALEAFLTRCPLPVRVERVGGE